MLVITKFRKSHRVWWNCCCPVFWDWCSIEPRLEKGDLWDLLAMSPLLLFQKGSCNSMWGKFPQPWENRLESLAVDLLLLKKEPAVLPLQPQAKDLWTSRSRSWKLLSCDAERSSAPRWIISLVQLPQVPLHHITQPR